MAGEVYRRLTVTAQQRGVRETAQDVEKLGQSVQRAATTASDGSRQFDRSLTAAGASGRTFATDLQRVQQALKNHGFSQYASDLASVKAATAETTKLTLSQSRAIESLERSLDPAVRNLQRYEAAEAKVAAAVAGRKFSLERGNELLGLAAVRFKQVGDQASGANDNVRLTSNQMLNLGRQAQDVGTMLAMGASPFQVITSQAAQVYDALASGPGGLRGSVKALGVELASLVVRFAPIGLAAGAATTAAYLLWKAASGPEVKTAEEALKSYKTLLDELEAGYGRAADAAADFFKRARQESPNVASALIQGTEAEIRATLAQEIETLTAKTQGFVTSFKDLSPAVLAGQQQIRTLGDRLESGKITVAEFRDEIAKIRIAPDQPRVIVKIADDLLKGSVNARELANALGAVGGAADIAAGKTSRLAIPSMREQPRQFGGAVPLMQRLNPEGYDAMVEGLKAQADAMKKVDTAAKSAADALREAQDAIADASLRGYAAEMAQINREIERQIALNPENAAAWREVRAARKQALEIATNRGLFDPLQTQVDQVKAQAAAIGLNADATRTLTDAMKAEQAIRQAGIDPLSDRADQYRRAAAAVSDYAAEVDRLAKAWDVVHKAETDAIDKGVDALMSGDWKSGLTSILDDLQKQIVEIGIKNPLKNSLTGSQLPTFSDLFLNPQAPALPTSQMTNAMNVNAAVVNIGGVGVTAALGGAPVGNVERGGALAAVNKLAGVNDNGKVPPVSDLAAYIRQAANVRGIDAETALRVARSEGLGEGIWQSNYRRNGYREPSFGPFQLLKGGPGTGFGRGLGNAFMRDTGMDPADPRSAYAGIDYALNHAAKNGWGAWYGADKAGIGKWEGLRGAQTVPIEQMQAQIQQSAMALQQSASTLAPAASTFTTGLQQSLNGTILGGAGQIANQFVPGLGGVVQTFLQAFQNAAPGGGMGGGMSGSGAYNIGAMLANLVSSFFDTGGYTGPGGVHEPAGIVHKGEVVFSQADVARAGGVGAVEAIRLGGRGYADGGAVAAPARTIVNRQSAIARAHSPANGQSPVVNMPVTIENRNGSKVTAQQEDDGRGGKRLRINIMDDMVSETLSKGRKSNRALSQRGAKTPLVR
ncbi:phage tail length tape measure family protein [Jiella sonneratiae]|uniref:Phage tail length tape measure family protein n=1 Tax=Jiella sonneratiae TaxID=2816856 RepID=A0ABS3J3J3_9HYPH|nr:phage tail length tape measure family protein [Jiella sonneratiae]MBO0904218.1 phage tail length tape measure family protein [Jiella sonneratiae]